MQERSKERHNLGPEGLEIKVVPNLDLKTKIRRIPEFKGVVFWDITPLLKDKKAFRECVKRISDHYRTKKVDVVVSSEARGFIIGAAIAYELGAGFVPIRKRGKLPSKTVCMTYDKEYEPDTIEIHEDAIEHDQKVLLVDDLLATGGTISANINLVEKLGGKIVGIAFLIELEYLHGRKCIGNKYDVYSVVNLISATEPVPKSSA